MSRAVGLLLGVGLVTLLMVGLAPRAPMRADDPMEAREATQPAPGRVNGTSPERSWGDAREVYPTRLATAHGGEHAPDLAAARGPDVPPLRHESGAPAARGPAARARRSLDDAPRSAPVDSRLPPPRLDPPVLAAGATSTAVTGHDPGAPRALVLWQYGQQGPQPVARARSGPDGRFDFGQWPIPVEGIDLAVAPAGEAPERLDGRRFAAAPPAPRGELSSDSGGGTDLRLVLHPVTASGVALVYAADSGRLLARRVLEPEGDGGAGPIGLAAPASGALAIDVVHVLPDGRRSPPLRLDWP